MHKKKTLNNNFNFELITNVVSGPNSINYVHRFLEEKNYKNIGLIVDNNLLKRSDYIKSFLKKTKKKIFKKVLYFNGTSEPTYQNLDLVVRTLKKKVYKFDCLVAIGGGSTIDFTKGIATLLKNAGNALRYRGFPKKLKPSIPVIAIPSTTGTGAELAYNAVFTDLKSKKKLGINSKNNYPVLSVLDPNVPAGSPKSVILNSSLGAITRSIDTMFNKQANKISKIFSEKSFQLLFNNLPKVLKNRNNLEYWSQMQWGAYLSVVALLNSSSGPAGTASYYLSSNLFIPQGLGYGISGICFFQRNHEKGFYKYSKLFDLIEKKPYKYKKNIPEKEKSKFVLSSFMTILKLNKITLKNTNISQYQKKKFYAFLSKNFNISTSNNPVFLNKKDLAIIINKIFKI